MTGHDRISSVNSTSMPRVSASWMTAWPISRTLALNSARTRVSECVTPVLSWPVMLIRSTRDSEALCIFPKCKAAILVNSKEDDMSKVFLITGASTGFGRIAAELLGSRGYRVFATMRDVGGRNAEAARELEASSGVDVLELDVSDDASVDSAVKEITARAARIDVVINNAGFGNLGVTEAYTVDQFKQLYETNVFGVLRVNRAVLPGMRKQGSGLLIHVSSIAGRSTLPYMSPYCSSKHALESIADAYRAELAPFAIDSVLVEPGAFQTPIFYKPFTPADEARVTDYCADDLSRRVQDTFVSM